MMLPIEDLSPRKKAEKPKVVLAPLSRYERSIAEIMRLHMPETGYGDASYDMWLDLIDDFCVMFTTGAVRFDANAFVDHCFGGTVRAWEG